MSETKVTVRKAKQESGYLLSVTRRTTTFPGPRCSSKRTAKEVATWIESYLV